MAMPGVDEQITSGVHRTGGQFYDLYPAYVGPGRLVLYWYPVYADAMEDSAKQQVGALSGHKAPADEGTAL